MMFRQLKVGERLQPFTGTTGQGQAAMLVIAVVDPAFLAGADVLVDALVPADQGDFAGGEDVVVEVVGFVLFFDGECHWFPLSLSLCGHIQYNRYLGGEITKKQEKTRKQ